MPTLRIQFPEKASATTLNLSGARVTVGRQPSNTIQILDRTLSAAHAEFIAEPDGRYRLHDRGSTNGTAVNGDLVVDYHLNENCQISFGSVQCEYMAESTEATADAETLPTRAEAEAARAAAAKLQETVDSLRQTVDSLKLVQPGADGDLQAAEMQRLILERASMGETMQKQDREIARLKEDLALLKRDRDNVQAALWQAKAQTTSVAPAPVLASTAVPEAPAPSAPEPTAKPETKAPLAFTPKPTLKPSAPGSPANPETKAPFAFTPKPMPKPSPEKTSVAAELPVAPVDPEKTAVAASLPKPPASFTPKPVNTPPVAPSAPKLPPSAPSRPAAPATSGNRPTGQPIGRPAAPNNVQPPAKSTAIVRPQGPGGTQRIAVQEEA